MSYRSGAIKDYALGIYDGPHATPKESDYGHIFLGIKNVTPDGRLDFSDIKYVSDQEFPRWTKRVTPTAGDVVFSYEATLHRYGVIPEGFDGCLGRRMGLVRPDPKKLLSRYLHFYFLSPGWKAYADTKVTVGATVNRLPIKEFPDFEVNFPSLKVQQRVVDVLGAYDDLIENNQRRIALLEESARLLYKEWFVHLRFPGHEHVKVVDGVPEGWRRVPIQEVCSRITDGSHTSPKSVEEGYPMASVKDMHDWGFELGTCRKISQDDYDKLVRNDCKPLRNDVLIAKDGSYLKHTFVVQDEIDMVILSSIAILRPNHLIDPHLLNFTLRNPQTKTRMAGYVSGVAIPRIILKEFRGFEILLPSSQIQKHWTESIQPVVSQCHLLGKQNYALTKARDLLLPRLMNGEIEV